MARTQTALGGGARRLNEINAPQQYAGTNAAPAQMTLENTIDELEKMMNRLHAAVDRAVQHDAILFGSNPLPQPNEATATPNTVLARLQYISCNSHSLCSTLEHIMNSLESQMGRGEKLR